MFIYQKLRSLPAHVRTILLGCEINEKYHKKLMKKKIKKSIFSCCCLVHRLMSVYNISLNISHPFFLWSSERN